MRCTTMYSYCQKKKDVDKSLNETCTADLPVKGIEHFYCDKYWKSHSHGVKVTKNVTINTNKVWRICCALHVVCLNINKNKNHFSQTKTTVGNYLWQDLAQNMDKGGHHGQSVCELNLIPDLRNDIAGENSPRLNQKQSRSKINHTKKKNK